MSDSAELISVIKQRVELTHFIKEEAIKDLHKSGLITDKSAVILWFSCKFHPKHLTKFYYETPKTIAAHLGIHDVNFRKIISQLIAEGELHRCGIKWQGKRHWRIGKQDDCTRLIEGKRCCEYIGVNYEEPVKKVKDTVCKIIKPKDLPDNKKLVYEYLKTCISKNDDNVVNVFLTCLQELGCQYRSLHDDYFANKDIPVIPTDYILRYTSAIIFPKIKDKNEILYSEIYPSNLVKHYNKHILKKENNHA